MENDGNKKALKIVIIGLISLLFIVLCFYIADYDSKNKGLQSQINELKTENNNLKNTSSYLYAKGIQFESENKLNDALNTFKELVSKYPQSIEVGQANAKINSINKIIADAKVAEDKRIAEEKRQAELKQKEYDKSIQPPLQLISAKVTFNAIDNPEASAVVKNISNKTVDAYDIAFYCYNRYDEPVNHYLHNTNIYNGTSQNTIKPYETAGDGYVWTLYGHETTAKVKAVLMRVHMTDGSVWTPKEGQEVSVRGVSTQ